MLPLTQLLLILWAGCLLGLLICLSRLRPPRPGRPCFIEGSELLSPWSGRECVWWRIRLYGKEGLLAQESSSEPLTLRFNQSEWINLEQPGRALKQELLQSQQYSALPASLPTTHPWRELEMMDGCEEILQLGELVYLSSEEGKICLEGSPAQNTHWPTRLLCWFLAGAWGVLSVILLTRLVSGTP